MGLLDFDSMTSPEMGMAMGLLSAGGPSRMPVSLGQGLAEGYQQYQQARAMQQRMAMEKLQSQMMQMQMSRAMRDEATRQMMGEALKNSMGGEQQPTPWGAATPPGLSPSSAMAYGLPASAATPSAPPVRPQSLSPGQMMALAAQKAGDYGAYQKAQEMILEEKKLAPKYSTDVRTVMMNGRPTAVQMADNGTWKPMGDGVSPAEKLHFGDLGGTMGAFDPYTGRQVNATGKTMSPDAKAGNALGYQRLAFDRQQADRPQFKDGYWVAPPRPGQETGSIIETPLSAPPKGSPRANQQSSSRVLPLIDQAEALLNRSTHSYIGAGIDLAGRAVGLSTSGAEAAAQLKALEGSIMMAQPRMEGPQSNLDVELYRQMAGQIGDSTVPIETRRAALNTIRELHQKYAAGAGGIGAQNQGGWSATIIK